MAENNVPESVVADKNVAEVGAYAEKPLRDLEIKYRQQLTDEGRKALELITDKEGEQAMAAFQQTRSLEDPRIAALRALTSETIILSWDNKYAFGKGEKAEETAQVVEGLLKRIGQGALDRVIADETMDFQAKAERVKGLGSSMNHGVELAFKSSDWPEQIIGRYSKKLGKGQWSNHGVADLMRGYFAATMMTGGAPRAIEALAEIGKLEGRDSVGVIQEHMPLILELRKRYPEVNKWTGMTIGSTRKAMALDYGMENHGFLWSPPMETYVHMSGQATPSASSK